MCNNKKKENNMSNKNKNSYDFESIAKSYVNSLPDRRNDCIEGQSTYLPLWYAWWKGHDPDFHDYYIRTLFDKKKMTKKSMHLVKQIGEDHADLICNERMKIVSDTEKNTDDLEKFLTKKGMFTKLNKAVELGYALSMAAIVMSVKGISASNEGQIAAYDGTVNFDILGAKYIIPITIDHDEITEACFVSYNTNYYNFVFHLLNEKDEYDIHTIKYALNANTNKLVRSKDAGEIFHTKSTNKWFMMVSPPVANNIDPDSNLPIPIWANALDLIKSLDNKYNVYDDEFALGRKRIFVSSRIAARVPVIVNGVLTTKTEQYFDPNDTAINILPEEETKGDGSASFNKIQETGGELREQPIRDGINEELNLISQKLHFGKDYYSISGGSSRPLQTATAVNAMNMTLVRTIRNYQTDLEPKALSFFQSIIETVNAFTEENLGDVKINDLKIVFEDSIFEDKDAIQERDRKDVAAGLMSPEEYRAKHMGEDKDTASLSMQKYGLKINQFLQALSSGAMSPEKFIAVSYGENYVKTEEGKTEVEYIRNAIENMNMGYELYNSQADLIKGQNPNLPQDVKTTHPDEPIKTKVEAKVV